MARKSGDGGGGGGGASAAKVKKSQVKKAKKTDSEKTDKDDKKSEEDEVSGSDTSWRSLETFENGVFSKKAVNKHAVLGPAKQWWSHYMLVKG